MCNLEIPGLPVISRQKCCDLIYIRAQLVFFNSFISELNEFGIRNIALTISL